MRSRRKGQTIFELLWLVIVLIGVVLSISYGSQWGIVGAIAGGVFGGVASYFLGQLFTWFCIWAVGSILTRSEEREENSKQ